MVERAEKSQDLPQKYGSNLSPECSALGTGKCLLAVEVLMLAFSLERAIRAHALAFILPAIAHAHALHFAAIYRNHVGYRGVFAAANQQKQQRRRSSRSA